MHLAADKSARGSWNPQIGLDAANRRTRTQSQATRRTRAILTHPNRKPSHFSVRVSQGLTVDNVYRAKAPKETSCIRLISSSLRYAHNLSPSSPISAYSLGVIIVRS